MQFRDLGGIDVEAENAEAVLRTKASRQRQADVAEADDADPGGSVLDPGQQ